MNVGLQVRILREHNKMSRDTLADLLHISPNTLYKMEIGDRAPTLEEIKIISETFKVDPSIFFNSNSTVINNGDNSPGGGYGNIVSVDKDLIAALVKTLDKLTAFLSKEGE